MLIYFKVKKKKKKKTRPLFYIHKKTKNIIN